MQKGITDDFRIQKEDCLKIRDSSSLVIPKNAKLKFNASYLEEDPWTL